MKKLTLPPKTLICVLRASPAFYKAVQQAIAENGDPTIRLWQGQAKTYGDGTINPSLFVQQKFDDHPGEPLSTEQKTEIQSLLRDPSYSLRIVNSVAGDNASDRALAGIFALMHADIEYRLRGGVSNIAYDLLYDGDGRNDKIHLVEHKKEDGTVEKISEDNAPSGVYAPHVYKRSGADTMTVFDPHSKAHVENLTKVFGKASVSVLSNLEAIADGIIARHRKAILDNRFRLIAPDGWDKRHDPERNAATERTKRVSTLIWEKLPELQANYKTADAFAASIQAGIIKVREAAYPGAPAKPKVKELIGEVEGCDCELLDDLADSGGSLIQSGTALLEAGANRVDASICHGPASAVSLKRILTDSCCLKGEDGEAGRIALVISHLTLTNTMARVEGFYNQLDEKEKARVTLLNGADEYIAHLSATAAAKSPAPKR